MADSATKLTVAQKIGKARKALEDLNRGEVDPETYSEDAKFHGVLLGELSGRDDIVGSLKNMSQHDFRGVDTHAVVGDDDHLVGLITLKMRRDGRDVDLRQAIILHANDQGQITEQWIYPDPAALKQLGR